MMWDVMGLEVELDGVEGRSDFFFFFLRWW